MIKVELEQFQGPLDLLLRLIEDQKFDISQVSLAQVTDQYLNYLDSAKDISATELADFLVVATKLLVIKSKLLLPQLVDDEEDSAEQLEAQLKIYKDYLEASKIIEKMVGQKNFCYSREKIAVHFQPTFNPPASLTSNILYDYFTEILSRVDYIVNLPEKIVQRVVSLKEKVFSIRSALKDNEKINFKSVVAGSRSRADAVVCFMALLELIKANEVMVNQQGIFDDIFIEKV